MKRLLEILIFTNIDLIHELCNIFNLKFEQLPAWKNIDHFTWVNNLIVAISQFVLGNDPSNDFPNESLWNYFLSSRFSFIVSVYFIFPEWSSVPCGQWQRPLVFNGPHPASFSLFFVFLIQLTVNVQYKFLTMNGFKPQICGVGSDHSTNWVTITAQPLCTISF